MSCALLIAFHVIFPLRSIHEARGFPDLVSRVQSALKQNAVVEIVDIPRDVSGALSHIIKRTGTHVVESIIYEGEMVTMRVRESNVLK